MRKKEPSYPPGQIIGDNFGRSIIDILSDPEAMVRAAVEQHNREILQRWEGLGRPPRFIFSTRPGDSFSYIASERMDAKPESGAKEA
jgi:hypothetical protein